MTRAATSTPISREKIMSDSAYSLTLPGFLEDRLREFVGSAGADEVRGWLRPPDTVMSVETLRCMKASRLSFADLLLRRMINERWSIQRLSGECDEEGAGRFVYRIDANGHAFTYIARAYPWDGKEKVGRRSDGANRDMFGALFLGLADEARIAREFEVFDLRDVDAMRTDADVIGWTPANRSSRFFDEVVQALARGEQPELGQGAQYLMRNGGFQSSGRNGSISYQGIPADHPLCHPFFADLFAIYLVRLVSIDLVNAVARTRNPNAAQLATGIARQLGIGNSSGQGMCVALQRWPHWVSTWVTVRELALAYAKSRPVTAETRTTLTQLITKTAGLYDRLEPQSEDYVTPNTVLAADLRMISDWVDETTEGCWGDVAERVASAVDGETREQFNSLLLDLVPDFCDAIAPYLVIGAARQRQLKPQATVGDLRTVLRRNYPWALRTDRTLATSHQHFWYHSEDHGEQRRGDRIIDPHEEFESFIDHVGLIQRLASVLASYDDTVTAGEVVFRHPELHFAISRVQYLDGLPYAEIRNGLADRDFLPAHLIRFFLASLGIRFATPLSIRYVRGTFFQGTPLPEDVRTGTAAGGNAPPCVAKLRETAQ
ncbi:hypothetical protein [Azospirillum canadense]|uniref:hypothetical protein n=1 Tax=Azospirillum canadense TaxID=403962 RepID=UPI0022273980|nr:hypothetical protein [Azospirillum canadense]MCW2242345.1 hypothetical protein [Azospirillum canadense]